MFCIGEKGLQNLSPIPVRTGSTTAFLYDLKIDLLEIARQGYVVSVVEKKR